jgi:hypothetical protein
LAQRPRFEGRRRLQAQAVRAGRDGPDVAGQRQKKADLDVCKKSRPDDLLNRLSAHLPSLYRAASLSGFAECRREWLVLGKADSASALLLDRELGSHVNAATDIPVRVSLTE